MLQPLLRVNNLTTQLDTAKGCFDAVAGVSFELAAGETIALVGESGCGKSLTALSIMGLLPSPPAKVTAGEVLFQGQDLLQKSEHEMRLVRGKEIAMVFQEPMTALNPLLRIGDQLSEGIRLHEGIGRAEATQRALEMLQLVGISDPQRRLREYPHQLSGGMRQRVMIAMALACNPKLLLADEPTTALDVTIQAQILHLMHDLQKRLGTAIIIITHDMGVVAAMAQRVLVMYLGRVVENAPVREVFRQPLHPYTQGLLGSIPKGKEGSRRLAQIKGMVPHPTQRPSGCAFSDRCPYAQVRCSGEEPPLSVLPDGRQVACWYPLLSWQGGVRHVSTVATS